MRARTCLSSPLSQLALGAAVLMASSSGHAAAPAPEGLETQLAFGAGSWRARSAADGEDPITYLYTGVETVFFVRLRQRFESGLSLSGETSLAPSVLVGRDIVSAGSTADGDRGPGSFDFSGDLALRVGWHGGFGGLELGGALVEVPGPEVLLPLAGKERSLVPSAQAWVGAPQVLYAWGRLYAGPVSGLKETTLMAGLGHNGEFFRTEAGFLPEVANVSFDFKARPGVRIGLDGAAAWGDEDTAKVDWRGLLRIHIEHSKLGEGLY